jgi:hypothetical protein
VDPELARETRARVLADTGARGSVLAVSHLAVDFYPPA